MTARFAWLNRWRRWIALLGVLLVIRAALPEAVRRLLVSQASQALHARVEIGDVDLSLLWGGIGLSDVTVRAAAGEADTPPLLAWKRLAVELRWLQLLGKTVRLREVVLESPRVALDRLEDGQLNLLALVPASAAPAATAATPAPQSTLGAETPAPANVGWGFGVDRLVLRDGRLRFHDLTIKESEPIEVTIEHVEVSDIAMRPGLYDEPSRMRLALALDQGALRLDARLTLREGGTALEADLEARNLPLHQTRLYIPTVGWSALQGALDAALAYRLDTVTRNELRGTVTLRDVAVRVPQLDEPALAWRNVTVKLDTLDLVGRRVAVSEVEIVGASLPVRPLGGDLLPLLAAASSPPANAGRTLDPTSSASASPAAGPAAAPWRWSVSSLRVTESRIRLLNAAASLDVGVGLTTSDLASDTDRRARMQLALTAGAGSVNAEGALRLFSPAFAGTVRITNLPLAEFAAVTSALPSNLLQAGRLGSELTIEAGLAAPGVDVGQLTSSDLRLRGRLSLAELRLGNAEPQGFTMGARSFDMAITELEIPGVLPGSSATARRTDDVHLRGRLAVADFQLAATDSKSFSVGVRSLDLPIKDLYVPRLLPAAQAAAPRPVRAVIGDLRLGGPTVQLARTATGIAVPKFSPASAPASEAPAPSAAAPPRPIEVEVDSIRLAGGRVAVVDRTVTPFFGGDLAPFAVELRELRWPALAVANLRAQATSAVLGKIEIFGGQKSGRGWIELNGEQIALPRLNPYAASFSSYRIASGNASIATKASFNGESYWSDTWLTLHDFGLEGGAGESLFEQQFGIPLSMALALMRDVHGDIVLGIPIEADAQGAKVDVLAVVGGALRRAIVNALASPLKLVGAVFGGDKNKAAAGPAPIACRVGRSDLTPAGAETIGQLAGLLATRPGIGVTLAATVTAGDVRGLSEQRLLQEWEGQGVLGKLQGLPQRDTRERVRRALAERAKDQWHSLKETVPFV
ncbi:MAG: DUF748 domain-containing protein [Deltaproteobacteria bacterium]|nr:DUF748 domain-containing protein [Deltaproteobacteria bacterium]